MSTIGDFDVFGRFPRSFSLRPIRTSVGFVESFHTQNFVNLPERNLTNYLLKSKA